MAIDGSYLAALIARFKIIFCMASWLIDTLAIRLAIASTAVSSSFWRLISNQAHLLSLPTGSNADGQQHAFRFLCTKPVDLHRGRRIALHTGWHGADLCGIDHEGEVGAKPDIPPLRARQDHEAHVWVGVGLSDSVCQFSGKVIVNGVEYLGSAGCDLSNSPIFLREYLGRHQTLLSQSPARYCSRNLNFCILPEPIKGNAATMVQMTGVF